MIDYYDPKRTKFAVDIPQGLFSGAQIEYCILERFNFEMFCIHKK